MPLEVVFESLKTPNISSCSLYLVFVDQYVSSQLATPAALSAACCLASLLALTLTLWKCKSK